MDTCYITWILSTHTHLACDYKQLLVFISLMCNSCYALYLCQLCCREWTVSFNNNADGGQSVLVTTMIKYHLTAKDPKIPRANDYNAVLLRMNKPTQKYELAHLIIYNH